MYINHGIRVNNTANISIITPIKGRVELFKETFCSVVEQSDLRWEWIIIDDGSSSDEKEQLKLLCSNDERIHYCSRDANGKGASYCRNYGADMSSSEFLIFLDADDILAKDFIKNRIEDIQENRTCDFLAYRVLSFHEKPYDSDILWNDFTNENDLDRFLKVDTPWQTTGVLWEKSFFHRIGGFNPHCKNWQDWEIHIRALAENPVYKKVIRDIDFFYRKSAQSEISTKNTSKEFLQDRIETVKKILELLHKKNQLTSKRAYYISKLLFNTELQIGTDLSFEQTARSIQEYSLLPRWNFLLWRFYVINGFCNPKSCIKRIIKKIVDKIIYIIRKDHFLNTQTSYFHVHYKQY